MVNEKKKDIVKSSAPIPSCEDTNMVKDEDPCVEKEKEDAPSHMITEDEEVRQNKSEKGSMPKCPPPYLQRLIKNEDNQYKKFVYLFSKLFVNIPLMDAFLQNVEVCEVCERVVEEEVGCRCSHNGGVTSL